MKIAGIIAEYNPFHNGHLYQITETKKQTGADRIVVVMSGDFVQRGAPAIVSKYARARMALSCGANLVLELPVMYATGSAEYFAQGAVSLLQQLGAVDLLSFGSECGEICFLQQAADLLLQESDHFRYLLQQQMREGHSYPEARLYALKATADTQRLVSLTRALSSPNNILGIEYCKALARLNSSIVPFTLRRQDSGYHHQTLSSAAASALNVPPSSATVPDSDIRLSSATAIRHTLLDHVQNDSDIASVLASHVPNESLSLLLAAARQELFLDWSDFASLLHYKLLSEQEQGYLSYLDVSPDLSDKIGKYLNQFTTVEAFIHLLKSKDLTYTRISRSLLHILLNIHQAAPTAMSVPYARILGFQKDTSDLLTQLKKQSQIPLISKLADAASYLEADAKAVLQQDILASHIYESVASQKSGTPFQNEYTRQMIIL